MRDQNMPDILWMDECDTGSARIGKCHVGLSKPGVNYCHAYVRIDIAERMADALEIHQLWEKREKEGPLYPWGMKRDDPGGEEIWRAWWNDQLILCSKAWELTDAALSAFKDAGQ